MNALQSRNIMRALLKSARRINLTALPDINPDAAVVFGTVLAVALSIYFGV